MIDGSDESPSDVMGADEWAVAHTYDPPYLYPYPIPMFYSAGVFLLGICVYVSLAEPIVLQNDE